MNRRFILLLLGPLLASPALAWQDRGPVVERVEFAGRANVEEATCLAALSLKPGENFTPARLDVDRKALLALGYFRSVGASQRTTEGRTHVTFRLVEWPVVRFIRVLGNTVVDSPAIRGVISTRLGQVLCGPQLQDDVRAIERLYRERGYVVRVSERLLDDATQAGILRFDLLELRITEVEMEGGTERLRRRAREALRELPPNLYRPEEVTLDQRRLLRVSGLKSAVPVVTLTAPGRVRILWKLNSPHLAAPDDVVLPSGRR